MFKRKNDDRELVKIYWFDKRDTDGAEKDLTLLLQQGWRISAAGGTGGGGGIWGGFVVLVRDTQSPTE